MKLRDLFAAEDRSAIEKWCRAHTQQAYLGDHTALCRVLGQFLMYVDTRDLSLAPHLLMNGYWEMWVTQAIVDYVKPGMRCIDVGANFGYYTLLLAELVGDKGKVVAYDPQEQVYALLKRSIVVSGFGDRAHAQPKALGDYEGSTSLAFNPEFLGSAAIGRFDGMTDSLGVDITTVDRDLSWPSVDFVKIDVQGHEMQVLSGMRGTISRNPKIAIVMEFTPGEHEDPRAALETISGYGLTIRTVGTDGQVRPVTLEEASKADTGDHRMLWLSKG